MDGSRCPACGRALAKREDSVDEQVREQVKQLRHELRAARHEISKLHRQLNVFGRNVAKELSMVRRTALDAAATVVERATRGSGKIPVASSTTANRAPHRTHTTTQDPSPHPKSSRSNFCSSAWWRCLSALTPPAVLVPPPVVLSAPDAINPPTVTTPPAPHRAEHTPPYPPPYPPYPPLPAPPPMPHHYPPIGRIESCYTHKNGTPRQPALSPSALSRLRIEWGSNPHHTLEGIHLFSHIWLVWVFDRNGREAVKAKVKPPRLGGTPTGVFACRTPHRPNPIGLSLVKLAAVEGDTMLLRGADLIDGTAILDLKPYLPYSDSVPIRSVSLPPWIEQTLESTSGAVPSRVGAGIRVSNGRCSLRLSVEASAPESHQHRLPKRRRVRVTLAAREQLRAICCGQMCESRAESKAAETSPIAASSLARPRPLRFYRNQPAEAEAAFIEALAADPRSAYRKSKCANALYRLNIDGMDACCRFDGDEATVLNVRLGWPRDETSLSTEELKRLKESGRQ